MATVIKEVVQPEVHWLVKKWNLGNQANNYLAKLLGEYAHHFATMRVGNNTFVWETDGEGWLARAEASEAIRREVDIRWQELYSHAYKRLTQPSAVAASMASNILTIPNEDYLFYRHGSNGVEVLVAGWGFRNFRAGHNLEIGSSKVMAVVTMDGSPWADVKAFVHYRNSDYEMITDADGRAIVVVDYAEGAECSCRVDGHTQTEVMPAGGTIFYFDFFSPKPEPSNDIQVIQPQPRDDTREDEPTTLMQKDPEPEVIQKNPLPNDIVTWKNQEVTDEPTEEQKPVEDAKKENEIKKMPLTIRFIDLVGSPYAGETVILRQGDKQTSVRLDNKGECHIDDNIFIPNRDIRFNMPNRMDNRTSTFQVDPSVELEYEIVERNVAIAEDKTSLWQKVLVVVLILIIVLIVFWILRLLIM